MNGSPRERAPDSTATSSGTVTPDTDGDASWRDLGDGLWLAAAWRRAGRSFHGETDSTPALLSDDELTLPDVAASPSEQGSPEVVPAGGMTGVDTRDLVLRTIEEARGGLPEAVLPRAVRPARRVVPLRLAKALRGLGRRVPSRHVNRLDEARTAENGLIDGLWIPYLEPVQERAFDLVLLVDSAPTMPVWGSTVSRLADEAVRSGAFRDVRTADVSLPGGAAPVLRWPGNRQADPAELLDGRGSRLFLVVTDGLAPSWAERGGRRTAGKALGGRPHGARPSAAYVSASPVLGLPLPGPAGRRGIRCTQPALPVPSRARRTRACPRPARCG
ncbi:hypothetical protein GCM10018966_017520 [Streptomyces yanii]